MEEAIKVLNKFKTVNILYGNTFAMHIEELKKIQEALETVLQALENSISKDKIREKIKERELQKQLGTETSYDREHLDGEIFALQELLEE